MKKMYVLVFQSDIGTRCETHCCTEEEVKERYWELDEIFQEVHLLAIENEIRM